MPEIFPFKGVRYADELTKDLPDLIAPPYDVISDEMRNELYKRNPYNIVHLDYNRSAPQDNSTNNKYTRAAQNFQEWQEKQVLIQDSQPALYLYEQHFSYRDKTFIRQGIFCGVELVDLEEGKIIPHEETLSKPKEDRLALLRHCSANFSPVFGLYHDKGKSIEKLIEKHISSSDPIMDFSDTEGQQHRIWAVTDKETIQDIQQLLREKKFFIADGHHRYETAFEYYREQSKKTENASGYAQTLMALVNTHNEGLLTFPTHRLITRSSIDSGELLDKLSKSFEITKLPSPESAEGLLSVLEKNLGISSGEILSFGLYTPEKEFYILTIKNTAHSSQIHPWIDTIVLQELVLENIFNLGEKEIKTKSDMAYLRDEWETKLQVDRGDAQYAFFMNKPAVEDLFELAENGFRLPQKSTYFYPKLVTGLLMLKLGPNNF